MQTNQSEPQKGTMEDVVKEFDSKFYYDHEERGLTYLRNDVVGWLRTTLHHQLQKARTEGYEQGLRDAERTWTNRYQAELDQPTEDKKYCNGEPCICGETNTNQLKV